MTIGNYFISSASEVDNIVSTKRIIKLAGAILNKRWSVKDIVKFVVGLTLRRLMSYIYIWSTHS